jgi:hypothetical protein
MLEMIIILILAAGSVSFVTPEIRYQLRVFRSRQWPTANAIVQKGEVLHSGTTTFLTLPFRSLLGYRYSVNADSYWGLFVLVTEDMEAGQALQKQADGKPLAIKYDPKHPNISVVATKELLGRRIIQYPRWMDPS